MTFELIKKAYAAGEVSSAKLLESATSKNRNQKNQLENFISTGHRHHRTAGMAFVIYFIVGGFKWITSSGDKSKAEEAKTELTQAAIGLIVVAVSIFIAGIVGGVVGINLLNPLKILFPTP
jgi:hypothetical protein